MELFSSIFSPEERGYLLFCKPHTESTEGYIQRLIAQRSAGLQHETLCNETMITNQIGCGIVKLKDTHLEYEILADGDDKEYKKFNRTHFARRVLLKSNIGERVVLDRKRPHDMLKEIESLYSAVVKPVINKFSGKDTYSVLIENNKLTYPVFLGK